MATKVIAVKELTADPETYLPNCCDSGQPFAIELPDHRRVIVKPLEEEEDHLIDDLIEHNAAFRALLEKSAASPRKPFQPRSSDE
jgi:hypothetical protein